jgi:hypothetical protein
MYTKKKKGNILVEYLVFEICIVYSIVYVLDFTNLFFWTFHENDKSLINFILDIS